MTLFPDLIFFFLTHSSYMSLTHFPGAYLLVCGQWYAGKYLTTVSTGKKKMYKCVHKLTINSTELKRYAPHNLQIMKKI